MGYRAPQLRHSVIHKSDSTDLAGIPYAFDKDSHILHAQPDRLDPRLAVALAPQKSPALRDQPDDSVEFGHLLGHGLLVQDESRLPLVGLEHQIRRQVPPSARPSRISRLMRHAMTMYRASAVCNRSLSPS